MFLVRRARGRKKSVVNSVYLKERRQRLLVFDFKLRNLFEGCALWIKCDRIVFFEMVPLACVAGARK